MNPETIAEGLKAISSKRAELPEIQKAGVEHFENYKEVLESYESLFSHLNTDEDSSSDSSLLITI